jgi:hypothetical protein
MPSRNAGKANKTAAQRMNRTIFMNPPRTAD